MEQPIEEKKVLVITYYWPPSGGSGVQRWLKFVKYLPQYGYTPYVFTPENPSFDIKDESLLKDVPPEAEIIHFPIWEPYKLFDRLTGSRSAKGKGKITNAAGVTRRSWIEKISTWIRANLIIPDPRVFWVRPSVAFLVDFIRDNEIRTIITTGPPHSVHLIGLGIKKKLPGVKWLSDFRDPWSEWGLLDSLNVGSLARNVHRALERKVLKRADRIVTITPFYVRKFEALSNRRVHLLTNGFDDEDFTSLQLVHDSEYFWIRHAGIVNERCDPRPFMKAVEKLMSLSPDFAAAVRVDFVGDVHEHFKSFVASNSVLQNITTFRPSVPHSDLIGLYERSALLVLILTGYKDAEGYMPGKLFEYIATGLPVLGVGPEDGDAAALLRELQAGKMIHSDKSDEIVTFLIECFEKWRTNTTNAGQKQLAANAYSRKGVTGKLAELLASSLT